MKKKNFDPANEIFVDAYSSTHSVPVPEVGLKLVCLPAEAHLALVLHAVQVLDVTNLLRDLNLAASCPAHCSVGGNKASRGRFVDSHQCTVRVHALLVIPVEGSVSDCGTRGQAKQQAGIVNVVQWLPPWARLLCPAPAWAQLSWPCARAAPRTR